MYHTGRAVGGGKRVRSARQTRRCPPPTYPPTRPSAPPNLLQTPSIPNRRGLPTALSIPILGLTPGHVRRRSLTADSATATPTSTMKRGRSPTEATSRATPVSSGCAARETRRLKWLASRERRAAHPASRSGDRGRARSTRANPCPTTLRRRPAAWRHRQDPTRLRTTRTRWPCGGRSPTRVPCLPAASCLGYWADWVEWVARPDVRVGAPMIS